MLRPAAFNPDYQTTAPSGPQPSAPPLPAEGARQPSHPVPVPCYPPAGSYPGSGYGHVQAPVPAPPQLYPGSGHGYAQPPAPPQQDAPWVAFNLSQDDYDYICALFCNFDDDDGGSLDRSELTRLARWLNYPHAPSDIDNMFRSADKNPSNGNSTLNMNEFLLFYLDKKPNPDALYGMTQRQYNDVLMQFRTFDQNGDGLLTIDEFAKLARRQELCMDDALARDMFRQVDTDGNGTVDLHEYLVAMQPFRT
eukprot:TRINITY_DN1306_c3_g1_i1.p1 TRINITY_DN1306_c3_g1~~TRINITY_DN1306_c3_g1_i1.p1  ORF type:complete len:251 (+),score=68.40 TRINITY_DN1306_c3_g1_i1:51-803(+)